MDDKMILLLIYIIFLFTNRNTFFRIIYTALLIINMYYLIKMKFKIKLKQLIIYIFSLITSYYLIKDPNPFYYLLTFYLPFPNFFRAVFIIIFISFIFNKYIQISDNQNISLKDDKIKENKEEKSKEIKEILDEKKNNNIEKEEKKEENKEENNIKGKEEKKIDNNISNEKNNKMCFLENEIKYFWENKDKLIRLFIYLLNIGYISRTSKNYYHII